MTQKKDPFVVGKTYHNMLGHAMVYIGPDIARYYILPNDPRYVFYNTVLMKYIPHCEADIKRIKCPDCDGCGYRYE